jgi:hypothetical protein
MESGASGGESGKEGRFAGDLTVLFAVGLTKDGSPRLYVPPARDSGDFSRAAVTTLEDAEFKALKNAMPKGLLRVHVRAIMQRRIIEMNEQADRLHAEGRREEAAEMRELIDRFSQRTEMELE